MLPAVLGWFALLALRARRLHSFFAKTNDLFTWVLFAQYLGSAIMICGVLYTISSVVVSNDARRFDAAENSHDSI